MSEYIGPPIYYPEVNKSDAEDCDACSALQDVCLYHSGVEDGLRYARAVLGAVIEDPDLVRVSLEPPRQPVEAPGEQPRCTCRHWNFDRRCPIHGDNPVPQPEAPAADLLTNHVDTSGNAAAAYMGYPVEQGQRVLDVNSESPTDATRGVSDDPIPQRECEHVWTPVMRDLNYDLAVCSRGGCGGARLNGKVLLPQPIDPRSEA